VQLLLLFLLLNHFRFQFLLFLAYTCIAPVRLSVHEKKSTGCGYEPFQAVKNKFKEYMLSFRIYFPLIVANVITEDCVPISVAKPKLQ
jgi:hypothetical protein